MQMVKEDLLRKWDKFAKFTNAFHPCEFITNSLYCFVRYRQFVCSAAFIKNGATRKGDTIFFFHGYGRRTP